MNNGSNNGEQTFSLDNLPSGYRFCPTDVELILFYLRKKVLHQPLPPNRIIEVANLYAYHPDQLAGSFFNSCLLISIYIYICVYIYIYIYIYIYSFMYILCRSIFSFDSNHL